MIVPLAFIDMLFKKVGTEMVIRLSFSVWVFHVFPPSELFAIFCVYGDVTADGVPTRIIVFFSGEMYWYELLLKTWNGRLAVVMMEPLAI